MKRSTGIGNMVGGPDGPKGCSNWPLRLAPCTDRGGLPTRERPLSPWVMRMVLAMPDSIAAAAWRRWIRKEQPPTEVPSTQEGLMPR
jgi:hypothetical protein